MIHYLHKHVTIILATHITNNNTIQLLVSSTTLSVSVMEPCTSDHASQACQLSLIFLVSLTYLPDLTADYENLVDSQHICTKEHSNVVM